jgi:uncharacterized protein (DUF488 family)
VEELVDLLHDARVDELVDVRLNAISRKPGFSKRRLAEAMEAAGIEYRHEPSLGNPKDNREAFRRGDGVPRYVERLLSEGREALDSVARSGGDRTVALLCLERDPAGCHRRCIAEEAVRLDPSLVVEHR